MKDSIKDNCFYVHNYSGTENSFFLPKRKYTFWRITTMNPVYFYNTHPPCHYQIVPSSSFCHTPLSNLFPLHLLYVPHTWAHMYISSSESNLCSPHAHARKVECWDMRNLSQSLCMRKLLSLLKQQLAASAVSGLVWSCAGNYNCWRFSRNMAPHRLYMSQWIALCLLTYWSP